MKKHLRNGTRAVALLLLVFSCLGTPARAQVGETAAQIQGQVTDAAGAAVPGATIVVKNDATGEERRVQTNEDGLFTVAQLNPAVYTVTVEQAGFKKHVESSVVLNVADRRPLNVALEAGNVSEVVTVTSETNVVQDSPTGQTVITGTQVLEIPLQNRDFTKLLELAPGVSSSLDDETGFGLANRFDVSVNGMRRNSVNVFVDGVSNTDVGSNITLLSTPTVDSIKEFKLLSSNYTAEVGRSGGGTVTIVTRGGENDFHGSIYDFARNDRFNANTYFNNRRGRNALTGNPNAPTPRLRYHNFGGTFSGPIVIPKFGEGPGNATWNGRDRTFFFFSHEQRRITRGITAATAIVPSLVERAGDFSSFLGAPLFRNTAGTAACLAGATGCTTTPVLVTDTLGNSTQARVGMIFRAADNRAYAGNILPASDIDPRSLALLQAFPLPNTGINQFVHSPVTALKTRQESIRIDHNINDNHRLFGRYTHDLNLTREPTGLFTTNAVPNYGTTDTRIPGQTFVASLTSVLSPSLVNEATYNFSGNNIGSAVVGRSFDSDYAGLDTIPEVYPENNAGVVPRISFTSAHSNLNSLQGFSIIYKNQVVRDTVTWTHGSHTFRFGGEASWEKKDENANNITQGNFSFAGTRSRGTSGFSITQTGLAFADFLTGRADTYSEDQFDVTVNLRFGRREFFAQDTWKLRPNLTVDLGVRYQFFVPVTDTNNVLTTFDPSLYNRANAPTCVQAACTTFVRGTGNELNGIIRAGVNSPFGDAIYRADKNNFSPRIGVAWDPFKKGETVIRAGYGLYYDQPLVGIFEQNSFVNPPFNNSASYTSAGITFSNPSGGASLNALPNRALIATAIDFTTPIIQQWSIGVQHSLFRNAVGEISYVGTKGDHLIRPLDINFPQPVDTNRVGLANANTVRPFLGYARITMRETSGKSRYHGLLSSLTYRFATGVSLTASYTFSKNLTDATNDRDAVDFPQNPLNYRPEYAEARTSRPHIFAASYVYELPWFRNDSNGFKRVLLGGWQFAGITDVQSGQPVARVGLAAAQPQTGLTGFYPNVISDPNAGLAGTVDATGLPYIFDPNAFATPAAGTYGSAPRAFARLFGRNQTNFTLTKNIYFSSEQGVRLQLRAEAYNIFNHTQLTGVGTVFGASDFARPTGARLPREFQFGAKLYF